MAPIYSKCFPWLTFICVFFSLPILALSMINFCALILYLNAAASGCNLLFHTTVLIIGGYRARPSYKNTTTRPFVAYSQISITCCIFVLALWIVAFAVSVQLTIQGPETARPFAANALWNTGVHIAIMFLTGCICLAKGLYLHMCFSERRRFFEPQSPPVDQERGTSDKPLPPWPDKPTYTKSRGGSVSTFSVDEEEPEPEKRDVLHPTHHKSMSGNAVQERADGPGPLASRARVNLKKPPPDLRWTFITPIGRGSVVRESALWD